MCKNIKAEFNRTYLTAIDEGSYKNVKLIDYATTIITGTTPSTKNDEYWSKGTIDFITIPDMQKQIFITETERKLSNKCIDKFKTRIIPENSLIVSCIATIGLVSINSDIAITNQQINAIVFNNTDDIYYFYEYLNMIKQRLIQIGSGGSATLNINKNMFSNIKVIIPEDIYYYPYLQKVKPMFELILGYEKENKKLEELKRLYLKKFFG